jgi:hypothetical protein
LVEQVARALFALDAPNGDPDEPVFHPHAELQTPKWKIYERQARAALAVLQPLLDERGWRDIEGAPKDGTRILLTEEGRVFEGAWDTPDGVPAAFFPSSFTEDWQMREYGPSEPTHWMPLPEPPESKEPK